MAVHNRTAITTFVTRAQTCDFKMSTLRTSGHRVMLAVEAELVRKQFRKARTFQVALRGGADVFSMYKQVASIKKKRYASHRRPAPSAYNDM